MGEGSTLPDAKDGVGVKRAGLGDPGLEGDEASVWLPVEVGDALEVALEEGLYEGVPEADGVKCEVGVSAPFESVGGGVLAGEEDAVFTAVRAAEGVGERVGKRGVGVPGNGVGVVEGVGEGTLVDESQALAENDADSVKYTGVPVVVKVDRG